jgi:hypothetical protein
LASHELLCYRYIFELKFEIFRTSHLPSRPRLPIGSRFEYQLYFVAEISEIVASARSTFKKQASYLLSVSLSAVDSAGTIPVGSQ